MRFSSGLHVVCLDLEVKLPKSSHSQNFKVNLQNTSLFVSFGIGFSVFKIKNAMTLPSNFFELVPLKARFSMGNEPKRKKNGGIQRNDNFKWTKFNQTKRLNSNRLGLFSVSFSLYNFSMSAKKNREWHKFQLP